MVKYLKNIAIVIVLLLGLGLSTCYATVVFDTGGDVVTDSSNDPVSDTNGPPLAAPSITSQPVDATVSPSATAKFTVIATGNPMPTYRWQQELPGASSFTAIIGATSASYTTSATTTANSSTQYECVVSSILGNVMSNTATLFVDSAPSIITQPVSLSVIATETATFNVVATGVPEPTYQWMQEASGATSFTAISGATSFSYTTPATIMANNGTKYECVVTNASGSVTSTAVTLTVVSVVPSITTQPVNVTVTAPATATFSVVATGTPAPTYQWMQEASGASSFTAISGATSASYTTPATTTANSATKYECVVTNIAGTVTSSTAMLTVNPASVAPTITTQPISLTVTAPATATYRVVATGTPAPTYQWQQEIPGATSYTAISGATSASYTTPATTAANSGTRFQCVVTNSAGSVTSYLATLTVNSTSVAPTITTQPPSVTVTAPSTATFTVVATGTPTPTYQWQSEALGASSYTAISGATGASYTTPATTTANNGTKYECVVTNSAGSVTSSAATLTVNPASSSAIAYVNSSVGGDGTGNNVNGISTAPLSTTNGNLLVVTVSMANAVTVKSITDTAGNTYTQSTGCYTSTYGDMEDIWYAKNIKGNAANVVTVQVSSSSAYWEVTQLQYSGASTTSPFQTCTVGSNSGTSVTSSTFSANAGAVNVAASVSAGGTTYSAGTGYTARSNGVYASAITEDHAVVSAGTQTASVNSTNSLNMTISVASFNASAGTTAPSITTQPVNVTVTAPATATFSVVATGTPTPTYQWQSEASGATSYTAISGATSASYTTPATTTANSATKYECVVTNSAGSVTSSAATLTVNPASVAPTITTQPISLTVTAPVTATYTVVATGTPAPTYQWQQEIPGATSYTAISGATSASYTTPATTAANSGTKFQCVVSNTAGSVTSNLATLTVNTIVVTITSPANGSSFAAGSNVTITTTATEPVGTVDSILLYNASGTLLGGGTTSPYSYVDNNIAAGSYSFHAWARDASGGSTVSSSISITVTASTIAPSITTQPVSATVLAPATATFSVAATGTPTPTYQWQSEASGATSYSAISGATSASYTTPTTTTANNGTKYECIVTNSAGSATSSAATLTVNPNTTFIKSTNYNANGQVTQIQYGNGTTTAYTYNPLNFRLMRIYTSNAQAQVIQDLNYTYDSVGQVLSVTDNVNTGTASMNQTFAYDALNRLTSASGSYGNKTYAYDSIGNITQKDGVTYSYAGANSRINNTGTVIGNAGPHAVTSLSNNNTFKYDANGNMVSLQNGSNLTQYAYDSQNRLQSVSVGGTTAASYTYDGDGGRTEKTVYRRDLALYNDNTNALLFGSVDNPLPATAQNPTVDTTVYVGNLYESESGTSRNTKFIYLGDTKVASEDSSGNIFYYHTDNLGGTNVLTDSTGEERELTEYDPFGQVVIHEKYGNNFATAWYYFTGKPLDDETGLIFLGARYYNPLLARFISPDTVVQAPQNPQTLNRYTYCNNNPVNLIDPSGHSWFSKLFKAIGDFFSNLVKNPVQTIINIATIVIGVVTVNPILVASGEIGLFNEGTSSFHGGGWNTIHQVLGYTQIALAVVGGLQAIGQAFSSATTATASAAQSAQGVSLPGDELPDFSPLHAPDDLSSILNNPNLGIVDKGLAAVSTANSAGTSFSGFGGGNPARGVSGSWGESSVGGSFTLNAGTEGVATSVQGTLTKSSFSLYLGAGAGTPGVGFSSTYAVNMDLLSGGTSPIGNVAVFSTAGGNGRFGGSLDVVANNGGFQASGSGGWGFGRESNVTVGHLWKFKW